MRIDLNEHPFCSVDVHLQQTRFVEGRIQECQQALRSKLSIKKSHVVSNSAHLMRNIRTGIRNISASLCEDALMVVAVQKSVFDIALPAAFAFSST
jgi:hypothetical protein